MYMYMHYLHEDAFIINYLPLQKFSCKHDSLISTVNHVLLHVIIIIVLYIILGAVYYHVRRT